MNKFEPLENEIWVDAKSFTTDYSGHYIVSNMGRCWSFKSNKFIGRWSDYGHWTVCLSKNGKEESSIMIGRLMLTSFGVPIPEHLKDLQTSKLQAMHLDGNSHNNNLDNFAWGDAKENQNEINAIRMQSEAKKGEKNNMYGKYGKENPRSKPILQYSKDGTFIRDWGSMIDVQRELGINQSSISACARGERKSAGGYIWKYKEVA